MTHLSQRPCHYLALGCSRDASYFYQKRCKMFSGANRKQLSRCQSPACQFGKKHGRVKPMWRRQGSPRAIGITGPSYAIVQLAHYLLSRRPVAWLTLVSTSITSGTELRESEAQ